MKTNAEMLKTIIEYAVERGYVQWTPNYLEEVVEGRWAWETVLFSQDFAKAVFGEENICPDCGKEFDLKDKTFPPDTYVHKVYYCECGGDVQPTMVTAWEHHLQQCVVSPDPILYYYKFVTGEKV